MKRITFCMVLVILVGCSQEKLPIPTQQISGRVLYDNKAAEGVAVYLGPIQAPTIPDIPANPHGVTDKDGRFSISTYGENDGAPKGKYQLMMMWVDESSKLESKPERFFGWYDSVNSKIMVDITDGENVIPDIKVPVITGPPEPVNGIPGRN
ncbi:MAG: hypothetical protein DWH70_13005 [Planctomycetota bacterium]|jgi:hypothetical protein|nr:MAG: hypothetical protein DWH70_13005 [Planctomycetota bacterium]